jgi:1A family penicillin-binding protein
VLIAAGLFFGLTLFVTASFGAVVGGAYAYLAQDLPDVEGDDFGLVGESSKIYDRNGTLLYTINNPTEGQRTKLSFNEIPVVMRQAIIAAEDRNFYSNPGFDIRGISRAVLGVLTGEFAGGGSTITQQYTRARFLTPEFSVERKLREIILAYRISQSFTKDEILANYLNLIPFGNLAYGIEAAANVYFDKPAQELTLAEAAMLAGIVQAPSRLNPFVNKEGARERQLYVLNQMVENGFITEAEAAETYANEPEYNQRGQPFLAPHFVFHVHKLLEERYGAETLYRGGLHVTTTLDLELQSLAERVAREQITKLAAHDASNAALIAMDPKTGEILTMLGSVDYFDRTIDGEVNVTTSLRQPGSAIKPLFYAAAFEKGWTPATLIWDVPIAITIPGSPVYAPQNYDEKFHGPAPVRAALANSYNIPAVKAVQFVGVNDGIAMARRLGISTFADETYYGPAVVLGGAEVRLLELASAYSVFATNGLYRPPEAILRITDSAGNLLYQYDTPDGIKRLSPQIAFQITDILSDNNARIPMFGEKSDLVLPRPAAAKTGTTDNSKDNWTIGFTPNLLVGVWVGNSDGRPMKKTSGLTGAGPIWNGFMVEALQSLPVEEFTRPPGLLQVEVCRATGMVATPFCAETEDQEALEVLCSLVSGYRNVPDCGGTYYEYFLPGTEPTEEDMFFKPIKIHSDTGQLASPQTPLDQIVEKVFFDIPLEVQDWAQQEGILLAPTEVHIPAPTLPLAISWPQPGRPVRSLLQITGNVNIPNLNWFWVEYGVGANPSRWSQIDVQQTSPVVNNVLMAWDTFPLNGLYTIRVIARDTSNQEHEVRVPVTIDNTPPEVGLLSPQQDGNFPLEPLLIRVDASDNQALDAVAFFIDGQAFAQRRQPPFEVEWNPGGAAGTHTLFVVAFDKAGNQATTPQITLTLQ